MSASRLSPKSQVHRPRSAARCHDLWTADSRLWTWIRTRAWRWYLTALPFVDAVLLGVAFVLAARLRSAIDVTPYLPELDPRRYGLVAAALIPGLLAIFWLRHAYARENLLGGPEEYARVVSGCTYGMVLVVAASYLYGSAPLVSRGWLLLFWLLAIVLVGAGRFTLRQVAYVLRRRGLFVRRVLIAGAGDQGLAIAQQLHGPVGQGIDVVGFLDDYLAADTTVVGWQIERHGSRRRFVVVGHPREAPAIAVQYGCDLLVVVPAALSWESQQRLAQLGGTSGTELEVRLATTHYDLTVAAVQPAPLAYVPLLRLQPARITGVEAVLQRTVDLVLSVLLLVTLAPVLGWVIAAARLRGTRPIFLRRRVLGQGGRPVTLRVLNPHVSDRLLIRGLPALLSVLLGDLALAGPRPLPVEEHGRYDRRSGLLLAVKPGLTGPWRLAAPAGSPEEAVLADVWWVRNWSIWQHLFVLFQTARVAWGRIRGEGRVARWAVEERPRAISVLGDLVAE